jgi:hypothetical protein
MPHLIRADARTKEEGVTTFRDEPSLGEGSILRPQDRYEVGTPCAPITCMK